MRNGYTNEEIKMIIKEYYIIGVDELCRKMKGKHSVDSISGKVCSLKNKMILGIIPENDKFLSGKPIKSTNKVPTECFGAFRSM